MMSVTGLVPSDDPRTESDPKMRRHSVNGRVKTNTMASLNCGEMQTDMTVKNNVPNCEGKESKVMGPKEILK